MDESTTGVASVLREANVERADPADLEALCRRDVFRYALRRVGERSDAEDVAQETLIAGLEGRARFRGAIPVRLWLLGIARRKVADCLRKRGRAARAESFPLATSDAPLAQVLTAEAATEIRALVGALPEPQREALLLQLADGLSQIEIGQVLGKSPAAVNSLLARARATLREKGRAYFLSEDSHAH